MVGFLNINVFLNGRHLFHFIIGFYGMKGFIKLDLGNLEKFAVLLKNLIKTV